MKKMMMILLLFAFSMATVSVSAQATKADEEYKKELTKYYQLSGSDATISVMVENVMQMLQSLPDAEKMTFKKEVFEKLLRDMIDSMTPIYQKNISLADLKELNKFYSSPAGKRIGGAMPKIAQESMSAAMEMSKKMQQTIQDILKK